METVTESVYNEMIYREMQNISSGLETANLFLNVIVWAFFLIVAVIVTWRLLVMIMRIIRGYIHFRF